MTVESSPASAGPAPGKTNKPDHGEGNVKETIESILVAFVLAFVFRAFVVEAFVIPTGSMAPTLLGAHMRYRCADCGYRYAVNFSASRSGDEDNIPPFAEYYDPQERRTKGMVFAPGDGEVPGHSIHCPNCGFQVRKTDPGDPDNDAERPAVHYGDRILVLKYAYLFQQPARWDVVVFKSPHEDRGDDPNQLRYGQNYIKRLVGRPGECVMLLDGDVYVGRPGDPLTDFAVQRKPRAVQEALWRTIYHNDYVPRGLSRTGKDWKQPWQEVTPGAGWDLHPGTEAARVFEFKKLDGDSTLSFDPTANPETHPFTDWLAYDQVFEQTQQGQGGLRKMPKVSDLKLSCDYRRQAGDGPLRLVLTKGRDVFVAEVTPGGAVIRRTDNTGNVLAEYPAKAPVQGLAGGGPVRLEFQNVDYRVSLFVDGREVATTGDDYKPDVSRLLETADAYPTQPLPQVRVTAERQECQVYHLVLSRDIYYLNRYQTPSAPLGSPPDHVMELGEEEYFVLGDNSLISGDARTWASQQGTNDVVDLPAERLYSKAGVVPGRFLLGKAFFVYWPAGYRPWSTAPGMVPNFGEMRFIH